MTIPQIAIIGTEGSGKTVLATVWAKMLSDSVGDVFLLPKGMQTAMYVEKAWNTLYKVGEWLPSTPPGQQFELQWDLHIKGQRCAVELIDVAGQDLRKLFYYDRYKTSGLSEHEIGIINYLQTSTVIVFVVNLRDFIGESDYVKKKENELILKEFLDGYAADNKQQHIAIVFTAWDQYGSGINKKYGSFQNYVQKELSLLYNAAKIAYQSGDVLYFFPVAAVAETEIKTQDGKARRKPKPGFESFGLDKLNNWLINAVITSQRTIEAWETIQRAMEASQAEKNDYEDTIQLLDDEHENTNVIPQKKNAGCLEEGCGCIIIFFAAILIRVVIYFILVLTGNT
jgi:GTPase SAR1 family protein